MSCPYLQKDTGWFSDHDYKCAVSNKGLEGYHVREVCKKESFLSASGWKSCPLYKKAN